MSYSKNDIIQAAAVIAAANLQINAASADGYSISEKDALVNAIYDVLDALDKVEQRVNDPRYNSWSVLP